MLAATLRELRRRTTGGHLPHIRAQAILPRRQARLGCASTLSFHPNVYRLPDQFLSGDCQACHVLELVRAWLEGRAAAEPPPPCRACYAAAFESPAVLPGPEPTPSPITNAWLGRGARAFLEGSR